MNISQVSMQVGSNVFNESFIDNQQNVTQGSFSALLKNMMVGQNSIGINLHGMENGNNGVSSMGLMDSLFSFNGINDNLKMDLFMQALDSLSGFLNGDFLGEENEEDDSIFSILGYPSEEALFGLYGSAVAVKDYSSLLDTSTGSSTKR